MSLIEAHKACLRVEGFNVSGFGLLWFGALAEGARRAPHA